VAWSDLISAVVISSVAVFVIGAVVLFTGLLRKSQWWMNGVKLIGIAVFLPLVLGGLAFLVHGTVIDPLGRVLAAVQIVAGLALMAWVLRLRPERDS
jgi:hypothetical protein